MRSMPEVVSIIAVDERTWRVVATPDMPANRVLEALTEATLQISTLYTEALLQAEVDACMGRHPAGKGRAK